MYHHIQLKFCLFKTRKIDTRKKTCLCNNFPKEIPLILKEISGEKRANKESPNSVF